MGVGSSSDVPPAKGGTSGPPSPGRTNSPPPGGATCLLLVADRVVLRASAPPEAEYALFDVADLELRASEPGRVREHGYQTTAGRARARLLQSGITAKVVDACCLAMQPLLAERYARGAGARHVARYLAATEIFQSDVYDGERQRYRGVFLDLETLAEDLELGGASALLQAVYLAALLETEGDDAVVFLSTDAWTRHLKAGERTHRRLSLAGAANLVDAMADLARVDPRPNVSGVLARADVIAFLRARGDAAPDEDARALYASLEREVAARDAPSRGPLAVPELWAIETRIERGELDGIAFALEKAERTYGRTPGTTYLRGRIALALRLEAPRLVAERVTSLALSISGFHELSLLAAEAWLDAGEPRRAIPYARDLVDAPGMDEGLLLRAQRVLARAVGAAPELEGRSSGPPRDGSSKPESGRSPPVSAPEPGVQKSYPPAQSRFPTTKGAAPPPTGAPFFGDLTDDETPRAPTSAPPGAASPSSRGATSGRPLAPRSEPSPAGRSSPTFPTPSTPAAGVPRATEGSGAPRATEADGPRAPDATRGRDEGGGHDGVGGARGSGLLRAPRSRIDVSSESYGPASAPTEPRILPPARSRIPVASSAPPSRGPATSPPEARPSRAPLRRGVAVETRAPPGFDPRAEPEPPPTTHFMRGASLPAYAAEEHPSLARAPLLPRFEPLDEAAESLALPPGVGEAAARAALDVPPRSVLEARVRFTLLSRELGARYRERRGIELRTDIAGVEAMQAGLAESFPEHAVRTLEEWHDVERHGAFLSEVLARRFGAEWVDILSAELGRWAMFVPPGTRVWPFGRVLRYIQMGPRERDLVAYVLELGSRSPAR